MTGGDGDAACVKLPLFKTVNTVNTILGNLETALAGTYHAFGDVSGG